MCDCRFSIYDVFDLLKSSSTSTGYNTTTWKRMVENKSHFQGPDFFSFKFDGQGQKDTPVATIDGVLRIVDHFDTPVAELLKAPQRELFLRTMREDNTGDPAPGTKRKNGPTQHASKSKKLRWKRRKELRMYTELEKEITHRLAHDLRGKMEVSLPFGGRADIVSEDYIVEVKRISSWRYAIGQIISYGVHAPDKKMRIHLFGNKDLLASMMFECRDIERVCDKYGIEVTYEVCSALAVV